MTERPITRAADWWQANRRRLGLLLFGTAVTFALPVAGHAYTFPSKPITIVVPFPPGGSLDATARILAEPLRNELGQPVVVVNRPGAGTAIGARAVASSRADGYTLLLTSGAAFGFMHLLVPDFNLQLSDFEPIGAVANNISVFAANINTPIRSLADLLTYARRRPNGISFCTTGHGGLNHLQLEMFKVAAKADGQAVNLAHVPYAGAVPALTALRAGEVQACTLPYSGMIRDLNGKEIRILAVQRPTRLPALPDTPTTGEQGFKVLDANEAFVNLLAPKGTPEAVIARLEAALARTMRDPAIIKRLNEIDVLPIYMNRAETQKWLRDDVKRFSDIIHAAGLVVIRR